ncbi:peptidase M24 [Desulfatibacillum aliphaticivorans]|uniref:Peptidase M24 n=1 Tax=Desulfatibacillum aliphaticivorans TaxID=218208 RepID=B8FLM2_DESAL|nr:Xaa-Pro peptidase family protein [Desulfatibacillum aliphaticivorans]ACL05376.1 peptidase M24 [Desulfatibacillum aliphaticivorans]
MADMTAPVTAPPTQEELLLRLSKVREGMKKAGLDYYLTAHTDNVYYLTNFSYIPFERPFFLIIAADGAQVMILPGLELSHAQDRVIPDVVYKTYYEYPAPPGKGFEDALKEVIPSNAKVGVESSLSLALKDVAPGDVMVIDLVDEARVVKSDYEVGRIAYAAQVCDEGLKKIFELSKPEAMELTFFSEAGRHMMGKVVMEVPGLNLLVSKFLGAVWPKNLSAQPHSVPGLFDLLEEGGPQVTIIAAQADGYSAELERTFFIGSVPEEAKTPFKVMEEARALAYDLVKPGVRAEDVDRAVLKVLQDAGYGDCILHRTGHGFGITGHEPPWIALGSDAVLEKNMVISIEPGIYIQGLGGFRHSDTVLVTDNGCQSLTNGPAGLEDLILPV